MKSGSNRLETDILGFDAAGFDSPEVDGQEPGAGDNGFLFGGRPRFGSLAQHMMELLDSAPGTVPEAEPPNGFHEHTAHASVALPVNGSQTPRPATGLLAGGASDEAADLLSIVEAVPIQDFRLEALAGALSEACGTPPILDLLNRDSFRLQGCHACGGVQDQFAMGFEHGKNPGIELFEETRPNPGSPPAFWNHKVAVFLKQTPPMADEHVPHLQKLGALPPERAPAFLLGSGRPHDLELLLVAPHQEVEQLRAELAGVHAVGLAFAVEGFGGHHQAGHPRLFQRPVESVAEAAGFLDADDGDASLDEFEADLENAFPRVLSQNLGRSGVVAHGDHRSLLLHIEPDVESSTSLGDKGVYSVRDACC